MEGGHEACRTTRTSGQIAEFHPVTFAAHVITVAQAVRSLRVSMSKHRELTGCLKVLRSDLEKDVSEGETDPPTPHGDDSAHDE